MNDYRIVRINKKIITKKSLRRIREENIYRKYRPSYSETILEEICKSFRTKLQQAYLPLIGDSFGMNCFTWLKRNAKPVVVNNGEIERILEIEYTKYSLFHSERAFEVYKKNWEIEHKRRFTKKQNLKNILRQPEKFDPVELITNKEYIPYLNIFRSKKRICFAVFDMKHKRSRFNKAWDDLSSSKYPEICITFDMEPIFEVGNSYEDQSNIYDKLTFSFPSTALEHFYKIIYAHMLHPISQINRDIPKFETTYKICSCEERKTTLGFITAYLRNFCLGKTFY